MIGGNKRQMTLTLIYAFLIVYIIINLLPYAWLIITSFKTRVDAFSIPPKWIFDPTFTNYKEAFLDKGFLLNLRNSLIVTASAPARAADRTALGLCFSRLRIKGEKALMVLLLGARFLRWGSGPPLVPGHGKKWPVKPYVGIVIAHIT